MSSLKVTTITDGTNQVTTEALCKSSAKAWVKFNGTGTVAINASYNVSSVTDMGTGTYKINLSKAMNSNHYALVGFSGRASVGSILTHDSTCPVDRTSATIQTRLLGGTVSTVDSDYVYLAFLGD